MRVLSSLFLVAGICIGVLFQYTFGLLTEQKVNLPEEWKLITPDDVLKGFIASDSTLVIRFYNTPDDVVEFQWDADEKDIPFKTGSHINVSGSNGNIIYLSPIDE